MSRFRHALQDRDQHILTLRVFSGVLAGLLLMVTLGWMSAPDRLTIHNPPDLRSGSTRPWWEVPPSTVYSFAYYIFQQLNAWPKNGEVDYPAKIHALSAYLTPSCREILETDARRRKDAGNCWIVFVWCMRSLSTVTADVTTVIRSRWKAGTTGRFVST